MYMFAYVHVGTYLSSLGPTRLSSSLKICILITSGRCDVCENLFVFSTRKGSFALHKRQQKSLFA
jgi:hypothetical protein